MIKTDDDYKTALRYYKFKI